MAVKISKSGILVTQPGASELDGLSSYLLDPDLKNAEVLESGIVEDANFVVTNQQGTFISNTVITIPFSQTYANLKKAEVLFRSVNAPNIIPNGFYEYPVQGFGLAFSVSKSEINCGFNTIGSTVFSTNNVFDIHWMLFDVDYA